MTATNELIARHNELARKAGLPELTEWKKSKAELEARIASLMDLLDMTADPELSAPDGKSSVAAIVAELLMDAEMHYAAVAEEVRRRVPDARTTEKSVASIALRLRKAGAIIPARSRPAPLAGKE